MSIKGQGHSLTLVKGHSYFKVKCLTFGLYTQVSDSGPLGPLFIAGRPKAALLFWFFGDFRCGALLFMVIYVIYKYKNKSK